MPCETREKSAEIAPHFSSASRSFSSSIKQWSNKYINNELLTVYVDVERDKQIRLEVVVIVQIYQERHLSPYHGWASRKLIVLYKISWYHSY